MPGYIDANLSILEAVGFREDEIPLVTGPVVIRLDPNKLPVVKFRRWTHEFQQNSRAVRFPETLEAVLVPLEFGLDMMLDRMADAAVADKEFADKALRTLERAELDAPAVDEDGGLVVNVHEEPHSVKLRGANLHGGWFDELATWTDAESGDMPVTDEEIRVSDRLKAVTVSDHDGDHGSGSSVEAETGLRSDGGQVQGEEG